jgi:hypothetical protein
VIAWQGHPYSGQRYPLPLNLAKDHEFGVLPSPPLAVVDQIRLDLHADRRRRTSSHPPAIARDSLRYPAQYDGVADETFSPAPGHQHVCLKAPSESTVERELHGQYLVSTDRLAATISADVTQLLSDPAGIGVGLAQSLLRQFGLKVPDPVLFDWQAQVFSCA